MELTPRRGLTLEELDVARRRAVWRAWRGDPSAETWVRHYEARVRLAEMTGGRA
jgi:hypothetical protein